MKWCVPLCLQGLWCGIPCEASARSREADSDQKFEMADRRDWGGGGDDPEESTQRMIERIWESLTDIQRRIDQQALVPPVAVPPGDGETVKEEDGEVDSNFSKVVVDQKWRSRSRVLPGNPLFHQGIDVIIAISRGI
ncbi:hypothetical protein Taro_044269 [Colocasia esculenta]|uniref:Uncharacterized protein n=1 Tax=Colocasia esculenta TaxID=4460 RepID=A0A843WLF6_COLES|nr:hypothetical protein [Colocasia esculenta]